MASPYGIVEINRTTAGTVFNRGGAGDPSENQHARLNWYNGRFSENDLALHL